MSPQLMLGMMAPPASFLTNINICSQILAKMMKMMKNKKKFVKWPPMRAVAIAITSEIRNLTVKRCAALSHLSFAKVNRHAAHSSTTRHCARLVKGVTV